MTNKILDEYLGSVGAALGALPENEREALLAEMRAHLEDAIAQRVRADPTMTEDAAALAETREFGEPDEIAGRHAPPSPAAADPPRSRRRIAWLLVGGLVGVILIAAIATAIVQSDPRDPFPYLPSPYSFGAQFSNETGDINDTFAVDAGTVTLTFTMDVQRRDGCVSVRVEDPQGASLIDEEVACMNISKRFTIRPIDSGQTGNWRVVVSYEGFTGVIRIETHATSA